MRISDWSSNVCSSDLLLNILQERARELGVDLHFEHEASADLDDWKGYDLVIAADGANSRIRPRYEEHLGVDIQTRRNKFFWRSEERSVGKECVSTCRSRWPPDQ